MKSRRYSNNPSRESQVNRKSSLVSRDGRVSLSGPGSERGWCSDRVDNIGCSPQREVRSGEVVDERHRKIQVGVWPGHHSFMNPEE
jgi:hypothetical protein